MNFEISAALDALGDGIRETAEMAHVKVNEFHENYVSKLVPDCGKFGDAARFITEMAPGVSEYNAIREGDWQAFAIAAGIDLASVAIGVFTAGAGYAAVKGGVNVAKVGVKTATREIAEAGVEKVVKEAAEIGVEKLAKEGAEEGAQRLLQETADEVVENLFHLDVPESQIVKNKIDGIAREEKVLEELISRYGDGNVIREAFLRDKNGMPIKDLVTEEARRIDFIISQGEKVIKSIEVTSETASKTAQIAKELRILEWAKDHGGAFIKNPNTEKLIEFGEDIITEIRRLA